MTAQPDEAARADAVHRIPVPPPEGPLTAEGRALLEQHRAWEAIEPLRRAVASREPGSADLLVRAYLDSGSWTAAIEFLTPLLEQGHLEFAGRLGVALGELGDHSRAEQMLRLAVAQRELPAANDLALLLRADGRFAEAVRVLTDAAEAGDRQAPDNLVALHLEAEDLAAAVEAAERYADERRPDTLVALADVRAVQGRAAEADSLYRRAGELDAVRAHTAYAAFLVARGDLDGADREYREAERHNEPGWAWTIGRFLLDTGRPEAARWYLEMAVTWGDRAAAEALAELDGEDPTDD
jgi:tetratricopeptide (TPR) repeat protein